MVRTVAGLLVVSMLMQAGPLAANPVFEDGPTAHAAILPSPSSRSRPANDVAGASTPVTPEPSAALQLATSSAIESVFGGAPNLLQSRLETAAGVMSAISSALRAPTAPTSSAQSTSVLHGHFSLPGRPAPPDPAWQVPVLVTFLQPGTSVVQSTSTTTTDASGNFAVSVPPGTYDVQIKNPQALSKLAQNVALAAGDSPVLDFGSLSVGDVNNDDAVDLLDFSSLRTTFGLCSGTAGYDARADLNGDGCVDLLDFSLLRTSFGQVGPQLVAVATPPRTTIVAAPAPKTIATSATFQFTSSATNSTFDCQLDGGGFSPCTGPVTYANLSVAGHTFAVRARDSSGRLDPTPPTFTWLVVGAPLPPPNPVAIAPALDTTVVTSLQSATSFLYTGSNPIQTGVAAATIQTQQAAVIRGVVQTRAGQVLPGATITVLGHPEFGQTVSQSTGAYDLAVNGGGPLTLNYALDGYLPAQRQVQAPWQDYIAADPVAMVPLDPAVTAVDLTSPAPMQVARGTPSSDADGTRQATLLVPQGTTATMILANGTTQPLTALHVRATEYTVGPNGPAAMPAPLPSTTGYTYAVELTADEELAAGAPEVTFSQPLHLYLENFLGFPTGQVVPVGSYDRALGQWIPEANGAVVKILSISGGVANLDVDGSGSPASSAELSTLAITPAELTQIAALYPAGQSLWRVPTSHFSRPWDYNWPTGPDCPANTSCAPGQPDPCSATDCPPLTCNNTQAGSLIGCETQSLGETLPVVGTPFTLNYQSNRQAGLLAADTVNIPLSGPAPPSTLKRIDLEINVAGQTLAGSYAASPNQGTTFTWNRKDGYGRPVQGQALITVRVGYVYPAAYLTPDQKTALAAQAAIFGHFTYDGAQATASNRGDEITLWQVWQGLIGGWNDRSQVMGGWTLDVHHAYDPIGKVLYTGNGQRRSARAMLGGVIATIAGDGSPGGAGDAGPATQATLDRPASVAVGPDGSVYIADTFNARVRRVGPDGIITTIAGIGNGNGIGNGFSGDGGPATQAQLNNPTGVAVGPDGSVYLFDAGNARVRRVSPNGIITTAAGNGTVGYSGDGGPATLAALNPAPAGTYPDGVAVGADGTLFIADSSNNRIRRVGSDGLISTVAGNGSGGFSGDGGLAVNAQMLSPNGVAIGPDASLYIADSSNYRVRKVTPSGVISTIAGTGGYCPSPSTCGDGGPATQASVVQPLGVAVGPDGSVFVAAQTNGASWAVRRVGPDGIIRSFAGVEAEFGPGCCGFAGDGGPAPQALFSGNGIYGVAVRPNGGLVIADRGNDRIREVEPLAPGAVAGQPFLTSDDGSELYAFDTSGRHLKTVNALTGATLDQFAYDAQGQLSTITDGNGNVTTIQRDSTGQATAIVAPFGQQTNLAVDANGYLSRMTDPAGLSIQFSSTAQGLLTGMTDARGGVHSFTYDPLGRLTIDQEPGGSSKTLARTDNATGYTVTLTTALGHVTQYAVSRLSTGDVQRIVTAPDGTQTTSISRSDGSATTTSADGTVTNVVYGPDPRFGMLAPLLASRTVTTPSGLTSTVTLTRAVSLTDPTNSLSLTQQTDSLVVNGQAYSQVYNAASNAFIETTPAGRTQSTTINTLGQLVSQQVGNLLPTSYAYDNNGRLNTISQGTGTSARKSTFAYNPQGFLASISDPLQRVTQISYDADGRVTQQVLPGSRTVAYAYDGDSNIGGITPPGQPTHNFSYNPDDLQSAYTPPNVGAGTNQTVDSYNKDDQLSQISLPTGQSMNFGYDTSGRLNAITIPRGGISYSYDSAGRINSLTAPGGLSLSNSYDGSLLTGATSSGIVTGSVGQTYDDNLRITGLSVNGANKITFGYDPDSLLTSAGSESLMYTSQSGLLNTTALGNISDQWTYDGFGDPSGYTATANASTAYSVQYTRDQLGRITSKSETITGASSTTTYTYDSAGRLSNVATPTGTTTYTYDANGNRLSASGPSGTVSGNYDAQDRLLSYGSNTYTYTADGQLQSKTDTGSGSGQTTSYQYDELGNLIGVTLPNGTQIGYLVDGLNRRVGKIVNGQVVQEFIYDDILLYQDDFRPVAELDGNGNVVSRFVYGSRATVPDYVIKNGNTYRIIADDVGSPRLVVDVSSGQIAQRIDYDEFGNLLQDSNPGFQPFGFAGGLYDRDLGLVRFGARDYDATAGRWISKDPIGFAGGDSNLYAYAAGDPVNSVDVSGLTVYQCYLLSHTTIKIESADATLNGHWGFSPAGGLIAGLFGILHWTPGQVRQESSIGSTCFEADTTLEDQDIYDQIQRDMANPPAYNGILFNCEDWSANTLGTWALFSLGNDWARAAAQTAATEFRVPAPSFSDLWNFIVGSTPFAGGF